MVTEEFVVVVVVLVVRAPAQNLAPCFFVSQHEVLSTHFGCTILEFVPTQTS